jgi:predicted permease
VSPQYFAALKIPLITGRTFTKRDTAASAPVLIINEAFARKYFPKQNPLGQQILIGRIMGPNFADRSRQIVGVVGNTRDAGLGLPAPPEMFEPEAQVSNALMNLDRQLVPLNWVIRTTGSPMALIGRIRQETLAASGGIPMAAPKLLSAILSGSVARQCFLMTLLSIFAGIALLLGTVGLYGVISYSVAQRTREMGIRAAMGARRTDLLKLILGEGMRLVAIGLAIGLTAAFALTRFLQSMLYGISSSDPAVFAAVTALLGSIALAACFIPAMRASRVDPLIALREE